MLHTDCQTNHAANPIVFSQRSAARRVSPAFSVFAFEHSCPQLNSGKARKTVIPADQALGFYTQAGQVWFPETRSVA